MGVKVLYVCVCANWGYMYLTNIMSCRRAGCLTVADCDDALPHCIAAGNVELAIQHLTNRGHLSDAVLVAAAADEGGISSASDKSRRRGFRKSRTEDCDQQTRFAVLYLSPQISCRTTL